MFDRVIMQHCQVPELTVGGVMNEGFESMRLGLGGMPAAAEDIMVARDIRLAEITGGRLHIQHISTARSVELVREGKRRGVRVTAEACPHHFTLTDETLRTFDSNYKMNPPLRTWNDVEAVIGGLKDNTIEFIATDHAPHAREKKMREIDQAPFGIVGLETLLPITVEEPDRSRPPDLAGRHRASCPCNPATLLGLADKGTLRAGADADITIIDPETRWTIDPSQFRSKSRNTPFGGWDVSGRAHTVIVGGEVRFTRGGIVHQAGAAVAGLNTPGIAGVIPRIGRTRLRPSLLRSRRLESPPRRSTLSSGEIADLGRSGTEPCAGSSTATTSCMRRDGSARS